MRTLVLASVAAAFVAAAGFVTGASAVVVPDGATVVAPADKAANGEIQLAHGSHTYCAQGWGRWNYWHYHVYTNGYWNAVACSPPSGGYRGGYGGY